MRENAPRIRPGGPDDLSTLVEFNRRLAEETEGKSLDPAILRPGVERALRDPALARYFVAEQEGRVLACLMLTTEWSDWRNGMFWWVQSVYTHPEARGRGLFRSLYAHVRELARAEGGVCGLRLYVERENERARRTYEKEGMHPTGYLLYEEEL